MATNKIQTGLRISEEIYTKIKFLCKKEQRSLNNLIEYTLQQYIEKYEESHGEIPTDLDET